MDVNMAEKKEQAAAKVSRPCSDCGPVEYTPAELEAARERRSKDDSPKAVSA